MERLKRLAPVVRFIVCLLLALVANTAHSGVTLITHGLKGNTDGWVTGMANQIPQYYRFLGTNFTCYKAYFYLSGGYYYLTATRVAGAPPSAPESGEIIVKFDWSNLADGNSFNTFQIASAAVPALLSTNFIPELGGHALADFPLHLIGHSRGGSLVCEISRLLGTNGVWVDHLTTLDPHPLNNDGFSLDALLYSAVDAPARTYANVLFHDNYWQDLDLFTDGEPVAGAYVRQLFNLTGGYSTSHSDVHLWYHGTVNLNTPASDTEVSITGSERTAWWTGYEGNGLRSGFYYSLIGGGDRLSQDQPLGLGYPQVCDGYNQNWDLGAGLAGNRTALGAVSSDPRPSFIRVNRSQTNAVLQGQSTPVKLFYQWAGTGNATITFFLDDDFNPLNGNGRPVYSLLAPPTAGSSIGYGTIAIPTSATNCSPGWYALLAAISAGGHTRYLYAPELLRVVPSSAPRLTLARLEASTYRLMIDALAGQTISIESSADCVLWQGIATNTLTADQWLLTNSPGPGVKTQFYRAKLSQ